MIIARRDIAAAAASGILLNLAYPPFHLVVPAFVCLAPAIVALERAARAPYSGHRHLLLGGMFGVVAYAATLHWMVVALWRYQRAWVLLFVAGVACLGAMTGAMFALVGWLRRRSAVPLVVLFPVMWTSLEWFLAHLGPLALTWLGLGTALTGYPLMVQAADVIGARGVTFLLAAANAALAAAWLERREPARAVRPVAAVALGCAAAALYGLLRMHTLERVSIGRVAVLQTDIEAREKWSPGRRGDVVAQGIALSAAALDQGPDLIVWPETALPGAVLYHPEWERAVAALARRGGVFVLVGGIDAVPGAVARQHNAAFLFTPEGHRDDVAYRKRRLVPLFEWGNGIAPGMRDVIHQTPHGRIGVLICGEGTAEAAARGYRRQGADALVILANDAWFAAGAGPAQHAAHLVMRAIETRAGIARAANRGSAEIVDPTGRVERRVAPGRGTVVAALETSATTPPYVRLGDWVGALCCGAAILLLAVATGPRRLYEHRSSNSGRE